MIRVKNSGESAEAACKLLRNRGMRATPLRVAILGEFLDRRSSLSAEELHGIVGAGSLSTIYRALDSLERHGLLGRCTSSDSLRRFGLASGRGAPHNHFECRCCGRVVHLDMDMPPLHLEELEARGFTVASASIHLCGTCGDCSGKDCG